MSSIYLYVLVGVQFRPLEPPEGVVVLDKVADVGVDLREDEGHVVAHADLALPDGDHGRRAALVHV